MVVQWPSRRSVRSGASVPLARVSRSLARTLALREGLGEFFCAGVWGGVPLTTRWGFGPNALGMGCGPLRPGVTAGGTRSCGGGEWSLPSWGKAYMEGRLLSWVRCG